jgi:AcrR family transcriptional regulator
VTTPSASINVERPRKVASRAPNRRGEGELLREQLIEAASRLLAAPVVEEPLSLRAVAREVGVVPQSVYLHFPDKTQLVRAVIERRFGEQIRDMEAAEAGISDPVGKLRARCLAYCRSGLEAPGHYALLFETRATGQMGTGFEGSPGARSFEQLVGAVQRCIDSGAAPPQNAFITTTSLWAGLHGIVSLRLSKPGFPWPPVEQLVDRLLTGMIGVALPTPPRARKRTRTASDH